MLAVGRLTRCPPLPPQQIEALASSTGAELFSVSSVMQEGISDLKKRSCDVLLEKRVEAKMK
jgi:hypothetical protein